MDEWGPAKLKEPTYEKFNQFYEEQKSKAPDGMKTFIQASSMWTAIPTEKAF